MESARFSRPARVVQIQQHACAPEQDDHDCQSVTSSNSTAFPHEVDQYLRIDVRHVSGESVCPCLEFPANASVQELMNAVLDSPKKGEIYKLLLGNNLLDMTASSLSDAGIEYDSVLTLGVQRQRCWDDPLLGANVHVTIATSRGSMFASRLGHGFQGALLVGSHSVRAFRLRILETGGSWSGALEVGFTACNPRMQPQPVPGDALALPQHFLMDSTGTFTANYGGSNSSQDIVSSGHNWSQRLCSGDVLRVSIETSAGDGRTMFIVEANEEVKVRATIDVVQDVFLYPVVNMYGKTTSVELLDD
mmetsp:Transcript_117131/g.227727  ORF Transcript_117131/g.227727 Transcript_117131/m.227727 type:complete len:305 (-) Transcript_117131:91-1005(-)